MPSPPPTHLFCWQFLHVHKAPRQLVACVTAFAVVMVLQSSHRVFREPFVIAFVNKTLYNINVKGHNAKRPCFAESFADRTGLEPVPTCGWDDRAAF